MLPNRASAASELALVGRKLLVRVLPRSHPSSLFASAYSYVQLSTSTRAGNSITRLRDRRASFAILPHATNASQATPRCAAFAMLRPHATLHLQCCSFFFPSTKNPFQFKESKGAQYKFNRLFCSCEHLRNFRPVDHAEKCVDIIRTTVLVVQVVSMLPNVQS